MARLIRILVLAAVLAMVVPLVGCSSTQRPSDLVIPATQYEAAFESARELLIERGFELERVDASRGVISTKPIESAGLFTPFDQRQSSLRQELDDTLNHQRRTVRVEFSPVVPDAIEPRIDPPAPAAPIGDESRLDRELVARFSVVIERRTGADRVVEPESVRLGSRPRDRLLRDRRIPLVGFAPAREDRLYAGRLATALAERLGIEIPEAITPERERRPWEDPLRRRR